MDLVKIWVNAFCFMARNPSECILVYVVNMGGISKAPITWNHCHNYPTAICWTGIHIKCHPVCEAFICFVLSGNRSGFSMGAIVGKRIKNCANYHQENVAFDKKIENNFRKLSNCIENYQWCNYMVKGQFELQISEKRYLPQCLLRNFIVFCANRISESMWYLSARIALERKSSTLI